MVSMVEWFLFTATGIILIIVAYQIVFCISKKLVKSKGESMDPPKEMWRSSIIVSPIITLFATAFIAVASWGNFAEWGFAFPTGDVVRTVIVVGFLAAIPACILEDLSKTSETRFNGIVSMDSLPAYFLLVILFASLAEELLFRGFLQQFIDKAFLISMDVNGSIITSGVIVSAFLFGLVHAVPAKMMGRKAPHLMLGAFLLGLTAGVGLSSSGSILVPIIIHMEFNIVGVIIPRILEGSQ